MHRGPFPVAPGAAHLLWTRVFDDDDAYAPDALGSATCSLEARFVDGVGDRPLGEATACWTAGTLTEGPCAWPQIAAGPPPEPVLAATSGRDVVDEVLWPWFQLDVLRIDDADPLPAAASVRCRMNDETTPSREATLLGVDPAQVRPGEAMRLRAELIREGMPGGAAAWCEVSFTDGDQRAIPSLQHCWTAADARTRPGPCEPSPSR